MTKAQPPEYPRNVPEIDLDEDVILPGTIVVESKHRQSLHPEEEARQRAVKRRRIEAHAHAYLRGEGLYISTASLRGPFDGSWKNPWKPRVQPAQRARSKSANVARKRRPQPSVEQPQNVKPVAAVADLAQVFQADGSVSIKASSPFENARQDTRQQTPETRVHAWLKTNNAYSSNKMLPPTYSPTSDRHRSPHARPQATVKIRRPWTPTKQVVEPASQLGRVPPHQSPRRDDTLRNAASFTQTQTSTSVGMHDRLQKALDCSEFAASENMIVPSVPKQEENNQLAVNDMRSRSVKHRSSTSPRREKVKGDVLVPSSPPPQLQTSSRVTPPPTGLPVSVTSPNSDTPSKLIVRQILASARRAPDDYLETSFGKLDSKVKQYQDFVRTGVSPAQLSKNLSKIIVPPISTAVTSASDVPSMGLPTSAQKQKTELQAEVSVLSDSAGVLKEFKAITRDNTSAEESASDLNNVAKDPQSEQLPTDSPPAKLKHAHSSNGSMKNAFRMTKRVTIPASIPTPKLRAVRLKSPPPLSKMHSSDIDMHETEHDVSSNDVCHSSDKRHSSRRSKAAIQPQTSARRGILKSCSTTTSLGMAAAILRKNSTVSSTHLPSGQHATPPHPHVNQDAANFDVAMVEDMDEEDFDLNGAINELGSFLSFNLDREVVSS